MECSGNNTIKILPSSLANMIAAGQVVGRPANVVKELVENAIDAGATQVKVGISDGGRSLIQVIDNGRGMSREDALVCFEHHSTSKIATPEDLSNILTFGFRGEALASIAAVSKVMLKTRRTEDEIGTQIFIEDSTIGETGDCTCPQGCNFEVRDLFYNIPARRKFLKTDAVELKHIIAEFLRIALSRIDVSFTLQVDGKDAYVLRKSATLKMRIQDIFPSVANDIIEVSAESSVANISGFTAIPSSAKKTVSNQYFFVNGRFFRSAYMNKAVMKAYENLIPEGYSPSYFIFLDIDPSKIDVNVDPEKTEIKFEDDSIIFNVLYGAVRQAIGMGAVGADINFDSDFQMPTMDSKFAQSDPVQPKISGNPFYNPFETSPAQGFSYDSYRPQTQYNGAQSQHAEQINIFAGARQKFDALFSEENSQTKAFPLSGKYIVASYKGSLILVNIFRAYEKIYYERYYQELSQNQVTREILIFPIEVGLNPVESAALEANIGLLSRAGFELTIEGNTALVSATPSGISSSESGVRDILDGIMTLLDGEQMDINAQIMATLAQKYAQGAAKLKQSTDIMSFTETQAQVLIDSLMETPEPSFTLGGRKTFHIFELNELDKLF